MLNPSKTVVLNPSKSTDAWLRAHLVHAGGSAHRDAIRSLAGQRGYNERTLRRARERIGAVVEGDRWVLPPAVLEEAKDIPAAMPAAPGAPISLAMIQAALDRVFRMQPLTAKRYGPDVVEDRRVNHTGGTALHRYEAAMAHCDRVEAQLVEELKELGLPSLPRMGNLAGAICNGNRPVASIDQFQNLGVQATAVDMRAHDLHRAELALVEQEKTFRTHREAAQRLREGLSA